MKSGIYQIENKTNGNRYIGSTVNLRRRWREHLRKLRHVQHENQHLQAAYDKYGEEAFDFSVLEHIESVSLLAEREQHYFDTLNPEYNIAPTAGSCLGRPCSPETRRRLRRFWTTERRQARANKMRRRVVSEKTRRKLSVALSGEGHPNYNKHLNEETCRKISEAQKGERGNMYGKHHSAETKHKMSEAHKGKSLSDEHCKNMSKARKGKLLSKEHRRKLSEAKAGERHPNYGKHLSQETRQRISEAKKGKPWSEEQRRRMNEAWRIIRDRRALEDQHDKTL